jgi:hypothetical protein
MIAIVDPAVSGEWSDDQTSKWEIFAIKKGISSPKTHS